MPFDAAAYHDDLSDIDKTKPLSVRDAKRIIRAARAAGLLAIDQERPNRLRGYAPGLGPHLAVDTFLGPDRESCPCNVKDEGQHEILQSLEDMHFAIFLRRAQAPEDQCSELVAQFEAMLND